MSAPALTTYNRVGSPLPEELGDDLMGYLDRQDLLTVEQASSASQKRVQDFYLREIRNSSQIVKTYDASQPHELNDLSDAYLKARSVSLIGKTEDLVGGCGFVSRIAEMGSVLHPDSQSAFADARWNCKVVGLIPFLQLIPAARNCLSRAALLQSNKEKFDEMVDWIRAHPDEIQGLTEAKNIHCKALNVKEYVSPSFYPIQGKVYNFVPKEIGYFTGLKKLSLYNNLLASLPVEISGLPLEELDIGANFFEKMPPVIPSLRRLFIEQNRCSIALDDIAEFIRSYIQKGGAYIEISLDPEYFEDPKCQALIAEIASGSTHTLELQFRNQQTVFVVQKVLEATQPLDDL